MKRFAIGKSRTFFGGSGILPRSSWLEATPPWTTLRHLWSQPAQRYGFKALAARPRPPRGNVMIYLVVLLLIFGVLGVTMVSLFSTSITSSATMNDNRRAFLAYESGIRYAASELLNNTPRFSASTIDKLNNTTYQIGTDTTFKLNIFDMAFSSLSDINTSDPSPIVNLEVKKGLLPADFTIPITEPKIYLLIYEPAPLTPSLEPVVFDPVAAISGFTYQDNRHLNLTLEDQIYINGGEEIAFGVRPFQNDTISQGGDLLVTPNATFLLPRKNGLIEFRQQPNLQADNKRYHYRDRIDAENPNYVRLTNIQRDDVSPFSLDVSASSTYVILFPDVHIITAEGKSRLVTYSEKWDTQYGGTAYDPDGLKNFVPKSRKPDIEFDEEADLPGVLSQVESGATPNFINVYNDPGDRYLTVGGPGPTFGSVWFRDTRSIGGIKDFCTAQTGCRFGTGIRLFFTLGYSGAGDGLIFALVNGSGGNNDASSVGGDIELSELLGYAGDSRLDIGGSQFLDNSGPTRGLFPPKIGLEFDAKVNFNDEFEEAPTYCSGPNLREDSRNDPEAGGKDSIQYVFWGNDQVTVPCRGNNPSYDDNRHNAVGTATDNWRKSTDSSINTSPVLSLDQKRVYVASGDKLIAFDSVTGEEKWSYTAGGRIISSPTVADSGPRAGTIYFGSQDGYLYAVRDEGGSAGLDWRHPTNAEGANFGLVNTTPAVGKGGAIFFASNTQISGSNASYFFALNPDESQKWTAFPNPQGPISTYAISPVLSPPPARTYIYLATASGTVFRIESDTGGLPLFASIPATINFSPLDPAAENVFSPAVDSDGNVYIGAGNQLYTITPAGSVKGFLTGSNPISSSPAAGLDGMAYVGNYNKSLYAVDTRELGRGWSFATGGDINSQPAVDVNGHVYFGSNDNKVYALYGDGRQKWVFTTGPPAGAGGNVRGRPALKDDGTVFAGSFDWYLYAINQFANPKNYRNLRITSVSNSKLTGIDANGVATNEVDVAVSNESNWLNGSLSKGPWAVRMEVTRSPLPSGGTHEYVLRTWIRQCADLGCGQILSSFFSDTRVDYPTAELPPQMEQAIKLDIADHEALERFIFGFTSATGSGENQTATIRKFQLSFIRPNDPTAARNPLLPPEQSDPNLP